MKTSVDFSLSNTNLAPQRKKVSMFERLHVDVLWKSPVETNSCAKKLHVVLLKHPIKLSVFVIHICSGEGAFTLRNNFQANNEHIYEKHWCLILQ